MEKILMIDGQPVKFKSTAAFLLRYKQHFHRDALTDIYKLQGAFKTEIDEETGETAYVLNDVDSMDLEPFYNLIWTLAKTANPQLPPPLDWLDSFSEFPLKEIVPEVMDMILSSMGSSVESKKKSKMATRKAKKDSN